MSPPPVEEILREITDIPLKGALIYLAGHGIHDFARAGHEKIKKLIQDKQNEGKYAFVPDKDEVIKLLELKDNPDYRGISLLIPDYPYLDLIRTGLLINKYQEMNNPRASARIVAIKNQIINRPNGNHLLKIARLPTTPFFSSIVNYLYELKKQGYSDTSLVEKFNEIVDLWESSSKFVQSSDTIEDVATFIKNQINANKRILFVLGMRTAGNIIQNAIGALDEEGFLNEKGFTRRITISEPQKVEVILYRET